MSNVVNIFDKRKKDKPVKKQDESDFAEIMRKNAENKARMAKERAKANQGVVRSHRLKR